MIRGKRGMGAIETSFWMGSEEICDYQECEKQPQTEPLVSVFQFMRALELAAKGAQLKYYGESLGQFRAVKDAWCNLVAHARARYDEERASRTTCESL